MSPNRDIGENIDKQQLHEEFKKGKVGLQSGFRFN